MCVAQSECTAAQVATNCCLIGQATVQLNTWRKSLFVSLLFVCFIFCLSVWLLACSYDCVCMGVCLNEVLFCLSEWNWLDSLFGWVLCLHCELCFPSLRSVHVKKQNSKAEQPLNIREWRNSTICGGQHINWMLGSMLAHDAAIKEKLSYSPM